MKKYLLDYSDLVNKELTQMFDFSRQTATNNNPKKNGLEPDEAAMNAFHARMLKAIDREEGSLLTKTVEEYDRDRDNAVIGFLMWCRSYTRYKEPAKKEAAIVFDNYFNSLGNKIAEQNYQIETATLKKLVKDITTETKYIDALATLGKDGAVWLDSIKTNNEGFEKTYLKRGDEIGANNKEESFATLRPLAIEMIEDYYDTLKSMSKMNIRGGKDNTDIAKAITGMDAIVTQYKQLIIQTKSKNKKVDNAEEPKK